MIVNLIHSTIKNENEIYFFSQLNDNFTDETYGVYLINVSNQQNKYFLCKNINKTDIYKFVGALDNFKLYYDVEIYGITAIILLYEGTSIKLKEINRWEVDFKNKLSQIINLTKTNKKRNVDSVISIPKIIQNYYCDMCEEDSMRFSCGDSKCHNNKRVKITEQNKSKSYCDICEEDSMRFSCDNSKCKNYCY